MDKPKTAVEALRILRAADAENKSKLTMGIRDAEGRIIASEILEFDDVDSACEFFDETVRRKQGD